jgi:hypothetical protein
MCFGNWQRPPELSGAADNGRPKGIEEVIARPQLSFLFAQLEPPGSRGRNSFDELVPLLDFLSLRTFVSAWIETPLPKRRRRVNLNDQAMAGAIQRTLTCQRDQELGAAHRADCQEVARHTQRVCPCLFLYCEIGRTQKKRPTLAA